ncbi:MAG: hypothetical protein IAG10_10235 [Planctomycetaceae bacterium]|nr:hypothetical protein [Planctomycetaceae bacterium]
MRSIPVVMTWEMLSRGRWQLPAFALAANVLPVFLLTALRHDGAIDPDDPSMLVMQLTLIQIQMFIFGCAAFDAQGQPSRLYAMPIPTSSLVAWQMLPSMVLVGLESLASTAWLNAAFDLNWPLWGPALFAAVGVAGIQAALWSTEKSAWLPVAVGIPGVILGLWFKSRIGPLFSQPTHQWAELTPGDVFTLLTFAGLSYYAAVVGVARRRCGEPLPSLGIVAWFLRVCDPPPDVGAPFATPEQAHFWFEWRRKGLIMPATVVFGMLIGLGIWVLFIRELKDLFEGFAAGGAMLTLMGFMGLLLGNVGPNDAAFEMGHFLATRPLTNSEMSRTLLKVLAKSVLIAWTIWAVPFVILTAICFAKGAIPPVEILNDLGWWYFPMTLLGCWTVMSVSASISMAGRSTLLAQMVCGLFAVFIGLGLFYNYALPVESRLNFNRGVGIVVGVAIALGTVWAFVSARRRALIGLPTVCAAFSVWLVLSGLIALDWMLHPARPLPLGVTVVGLATLVVAPLAAAPLALAWNRNR